MKSDHIVSKQTPDGAASFYEGASKGPNGNGSGAYSQWAPAPAGEGPHHHSSSYMAGPRSGTPPSLTQQDSNTSTYSSHSCGFGSQFGGGHAPPPGLHPVDNAAFQRLSQANVGMRSGHGSSNSSSLSLPRGDLEDEAAMAARRWAHILNSTVAGPSQSTPAQKSASFGSLQDAAAAAAAAAAANAFNYVATTSPIGAGQREFHTSPENLLDYSPLSQESNLGNHASLNSNISYPGALAGGGMPSTLSPLAAMAVYGEDAVGVQNLFGPADASPLGMNNSLQLLLAQQQQAATPGTPLAGASPFNNLSASGGQASAARVMPPGSPTMLSTERLLALAAAGSHLGGMDFGMGYGGGMAKPLSSSLYIKNLPTDADKLFLYERFSPYGAVLSVKVLTDANDGTCRGVGFVNYADNQSAIRAIQALHGTKVGEKLLHVSLQTPRVRVPGL